MIDTALALLAYADLGSTAQVQPALDYLKNAQRTGANDQGWSLGYAGVSDPAVTALVTQALVRFKTLDATLDTRIGNALATLSATVDNAAAPALQAMAAQAALDAGDSAAAAAFLNRLTTAQSADGSWNGDTYATALAARALATAANLSTQATLVTISDQALRKAINLALGRNAMDNLSRGELAQLTSLSAVGQGIADLTGLEWAVNLTSADLRNNNIASTTPLAGLTQLTDLQLAGNPVAGAGAIAVPALPDWGVVLMGIGLFAIASYFRRTRSWCEQSPCTKTFCAPFVALVLSLPLSAWSGPLPGASGLTPQQTEAIQSMGRAVLQAKKSLEPDPDVLELKKSAAALKSAVDEAFLIIPPPGPAQAAIRSQTAAAKKNAQRALSRDITASPKFRKQLNQLEVQLAKVENLMLSRAKTRAKLEWRPAYPILLRLRQMRDELDEALVAGPEERYRKLAHLKQKLDANDGGDLPRNPHDPIRGLRTLVRHYRNEQAKQAPASQHN